MAVEIQVLGGIEARVDGQLLAIGHARQRLLLAALLIDLNHVVPIGELADRVWGGGDVLQVRNTLHGYLRRLQQMLAPIEDVDLVLRRGGHALTADPQMVDLYRFRSLVGQARAANGVEQAASLFGQALGLWQGDAFAGLDAPWINTVRDDLHHERLTVERDYTKVRLRLGRHRELLPIVRAQAEEHPPDKRSTGQLMRTLYRSGSSAEAGHHPHARQARAEEPDAASAPAHTPGPGVTGAVPRQLPAPPALFTGREDELAALSAALEEGGGTMVILAIGGAGGAGKTYLALHWAHRHAARFPDGQLYVNLRGFDPSAVPVPPPAAVRGFLDALGVDSAAVPADLDAQAARYRSLVADRRMLIMLDNARDIAQVVPLLPGSANCTVLVTSRNRLAGLTATHAAQPLALDALSEGEARLLLARHLGEERLAREPDAVRDVLDCCAGLPLAISIVAARALAHPDFPLAHLAEELAEADTRLDVLDSGDLSADLRAVFAVSHRTLPGEAARVFVLLGLAPGPDISLPAAASLTGQSTARARVLLRTLERAHLVQQHVPGRYRMHDLVRLYAAEHGHAMPRPEREAALRRLVDHYLHTVHHAGLLLEPALIPVEPEPPAAGCVLQPPVGGKAALAWYDTERPCLPAIQQLAAHYGWHTPAWQLPHALYPFHGYRGHFRDALAMWQVGLTAAEQAGAPEPVALAHCLLGYTYRRVHQHTEARDHLNRALALFEQVGNLPGQATARIWLARVRADQGAPRRGLLHAEQARKLWRFLSSARWEAVALRAAGLCHVPLGEYAQARACCEEALALARAAGDHHEEASALNDLGDLAHRTGEYTQALDYRHQALALFRDDGSTHCEAEVLVGLGETHRALGRTAEARQAWQHSHDLYRAQHHTAAADSVQKDLDALSDASFQKGGGDT